MKLLIKYLSVCNKQPTLIYTIVLIMAVILTNNYYNQQILYTSNDLSSAVQLSDITVTATSRLIKECTLYNNKNSNETQQWNVETKQWQNITLTWDYRSVKVIELIMNIITNKYNNTSNSISNDNDFLLRLNVADFGCGTMKLNKMMLNELSMWSIQQQRQQTYTYLYMPIDAFPRNNQTIICDWNNHEFPTQILHTKMCLNCTNIGVCQGCLEYIYDKLLWLQLLKQLNIDIIISYPFSKTISNAWVTQLKNTQELEYLFSKANFTVMYKQIIKTSKHRQVVQWIYHIK